ncbi:hypothetical protein F5X99DRAFT_427162 [Biscogniauxia marginata]|nr:hypothetical protein F5X99DRAFT_427162 [Biscogniauxia marginata]
MDSFNDAPDPLVFIHTYLEFGGYHAAQLLAQSGRVRKTPPTDAQLQRRHAFLSSYAAATPETATYDEAYNFLHGCMVELDHYFFCGALTRTSGPDDPPLATLQLHESPPYSAFGLTGETSYTLNAPRCVIRLWRSQRGGPANGEPRHPKHALLQTLLHEMTHAYLQSFYCRCAADPAGGEALLDGDGPHADGHGELFWEVLGDAEACVRSWGRDHRRDRDQRGLGRGPLAAVRDPELDVRPRLRRRPLAHRAEDWYLSLADAAPRLGAALRAEWAQDGPGGHPLRAAVLRLVFPGYLDFVRARVPRWRAAARAAVSAFVVLLVATVWAAVWGVKVR